MRNFTKGLVILLSLSLIHYQVVAECQHPSHTILKQAGNKSHANPHHSHKRLPLHASNALNSSQAFNRSLTAGEMVNSGTGSLTLSHTLVNLQGVLSDVNMNLTLTYAHGQMGMLGLPQNWTLNIPYVIPGHSVSFGGQSYIIS